MRACLLVVLSLFVSSAWSAGVVPVLPPLPASFASVSVPASSSSASVVPALASMGPLHMRGSAFDLRFVNLGQLVDLLYGEALRVPHVIDSDVLEDPRVVSFQYGGKGADLHEFVRVFLDSQGFKVETRDGVDFVSRKPADVERVPSQQTFVYRPRYRTAAYLAKVLQPMFSGRFGGSGASALPLASARAAQPVVGASGASAASVPAQRPVQVAPVVSSGVDELVFSGDAAEVANVRKVVDELDVSPGQVVVRGWVYEVSDTRSGNSAFSLAVHVLGGKLGFANGSTDSDPTAFRFSGGLLDAAISALDADSHFHQVSDPHVTVLSGQEVRLNVGEQVPTLGSISYQGVSGTPVQSVDYQDAGLIFDVQPTVMSDAIEVKLSEQISSFVATSNGVNSSPTKNTREMQTTVSMKNGEVIVLGGLVQDGDSSSRTSPGWLPHFLDGRSSSKGRTEVLLVLQVQKI